jgi:hypothetical protein
MERNSFAEGCAYCPRIATSPRLTHQAEVVSLGDSQTENNRVEHHFGIGDVVARIPYAEPQLGAGTIDSRIVLQSHTS